MSIKERYPFMRLIYYIILFSPLVFLTGCTADTATEVIPDVSEIDPSFTIHRFDLELSRLDTLDVTRDLNKLIDQYPLFSDLILDKVIQLRTPGMNKEQFVANITAFLKDPRIRFLVESLNNQYPATDDLSDLFKPGFQYAQYYFPHKKTPDVYAYISEYSIANFIFADAQGKDALAVGLDFYLGAEYPYAQLIPNHTGFSAYLTRSFNKEHIVARTMLSWIEDWKQRPDGTRLLDHMIYEGQKLYVLDKLLPHLPDSVIFSYTPEQIEWVNNNELSMWAHFIDEQVLYDEQNHIIQRYTQPAPFTRGMPRESPGRTGAYVGYKIIESFMRKNPEISLAELIQIRDPQMIYNESRYRPR